MKKSKFILAVTASLFLSLGTNLGFSQNNGPLDEKNNGVFKIKTKDEMEKNKENLDKKGQEKFEKAKNQLKQIKNPTFEIAPNSILNRDADQLLGIIEPMGKEEVELIKEQNKENKKNEKEILKGLKDANVESFSFSFTDNSLIIKDFTLNPFISCSWNKNILTPVRDQESCGSCWAFAAAAAFEHSYKKFHGSVSSPVDLSEQQLVACGTTKSGIDAGSCRGGHTFRAFDYMKWNGVTLEQYDEYRATSSPCNGNSAAVRAGAWGRLFPGRFPTVNEIKALVNTYGSVATYLKAGTSTFFSYGGGVYNGSPSTSDNNIDHAVIIVGWCDNLNAWIIKNSWGTNWGPYGGYAYIGYDQCNIGKYVYWVYPNKIQS